MSVEPGKWGVIYNPKAGTRKVQKRWKEIKEYMDSKGVSYDYVQSEGFWIGRTTRRHSGQQWLSHHRSSGRRRCIE